MSDFGVAVVRGWVTTCLVLGLLLALRCAQAGAQPPGPVQGEIPPRSSPADTSPMSQLESPRIALQPPIPDVAPAVPVPLPPPTAIVQPPKPKPKRILFGSRYGSEFSYDSQVQQDGVRRLVFSGAMIFNISGDAPQDDLEIAADEVVMWYRGMEIDKRFLPQETIPPQPVDQRKLEFYLAGNVVIRNKPKVGPPTMQILRGKEIYYDVERDRAVAIKAEFQYTPIFQTPNGAIPAPDPFRFLAEEMDKLDAENYQGFNASFNASKTPTEPGLEVTTPRMTMTDRVTQLRNVFGLPYTDFTGKPVVGSERIITAYDAVPKLEGVPFAYFPYYKGNADEPLGPFMSMGLGENHIFGLQVDTTWNMFELFAIKPPVGQSWTGELDYLSERGPGFGSDYRYHIPPTDPTSGLMGTDGWIHYYGVLDHGLDDLGGYRGPEPTQPGYRDWFYWRHTQEFSPEFFLQGQIAYVSDKNFIEQYFKPLWDLGPNQETFINPSWQRDNYYVSGLVEQNLDRPWIPETNWLPKVDGTMIGQSLFDRLVYSVKGSAGYAMNHPTETNPTSILPTDQPVNTARVDIMQELSVPFALGPVKLAPYGLLDLTGYSEDLNGNPIGRVWGGIGTRASMALSHLYEDVTSDLFNIRDLYHKVVLNANYLYAQTNVHYNQLPILDRLNDDATDQSWRNMKQQDLVYYPGPTGVMLQNSPVYDPQLYAIRRAIIDRVDTLDDIDVLQLDIDQRLQTKRGFPGQEHEVDYMILDTSISYYPQAARDNFGHPWSFAEWNYIWNIGDRVSFVSTGWIEPYNGGTHYWTVGTYLNRPDGTNFYIGYRQTDPLNSRAVTAAISYQLSKRYFLNGSTSYDFGLGQAMSNSLSLTRVGTDLTFTVGITYNSLVNNFGAMIMVMPNAFAATSPLGNPMLGQIAGGSR